jgi:hypothetical protein
MVATRSLDDLTKDGDQVGLVASSGGYEVLSEIEVGKLKLAYDAANSVIIEDTKEQAAASDTTTTSDS